MMRVALTLEQLWHRVPGGTATSALGLAQALAVHPEVEPIGVSARHRHGPADDWLPPIAVRSLGLPRNLLYESWHRFRRPEVESATGQVDIVHATGMAVPAARAPVVVTVHDLAFEHFPDHPTRRGLAFFRAAIAAAKAHAAAIICPSRASARDLIGRGVDEARVHVVPWAVGDSVASDDAVATVRRRYGLPPRFVFWSGTIEPRKNLPTLLRAFDQLGRRHGEVGLVLAGPDGWNEQIEPLLASLGSRVHRLGFVPAADLPPLYRAAEVFCYPSLLEGFGLPVLEAMNQGAAVVTSASTATAEVVGAAGALIDPTDTDALSHTLGGLLGDPARRQLLGERARQRAGEFTWERTAAETLEVYRSVAT